MKRLIFASLLLAMPALAADKVTLQLSPNDVAVLATGLAALDGYQKASHDARGQDTTVLVPYTLGDVRLTIAHDISVAQSAIREYQIASKGLATEEAAKLANAKAPIDLLAFDVRDLNIATNPIPPSALAELSAVCPTCAGFDPPEKK